MSRPMKPEAASQAAREYHAAMREMSRSRSRPEPMGRELDPSWVALVDEMIRRKVAAGDTDEEILDAVRGGSLPEARHIETHLALLRLVGTGTAPREAHGLTDRRIRDAAHKVREATDRAPTRARVAAELITSEATLKRAMKALGMTSWPPAPPEH